MPLCVSQVTPKADTSAALVSTGSPLQWTAQVDLAGFAAATGINDIFCPLRLTPVVDPASAAPLPAVTVSSDARNVSFTTPAAAAGSYSITFNVRRAASRVFASGASFFTRSD